MTLIYIYGETGQGKTTLANSFEGYVISTDKAYNYMRRLEQTPESKLYLNTCHHNDNKRTFYNVHKVTSEDYPVIIIEGSTLASEKERSFIREIFTPQREIFVHLKHENHVERHQIKHGHPPTKWYKKWYRSIYDKPEGEITITNNEEIEINLKKLK